MKCRQFTLGLLFAAASFSPVSAQIPNNTLRVGVLNDMSGPYADLSGKGSVIAAQMAAEDFAAQAGPDAPKVAILSADHQNKADIGAAIARRWVDEEAVDAVVDVPNSQVETCARGLLLVVTARAAPCENLSGWRCTEIRRTKFGA